MTTPSYQTRVITERNELAARLSKLTEFINGDQFQGIDEEEKARLRSQRYYMHGYLTVLQQRIEVFGVE